MTPLLEALFAIPALVLFALAAFFALEVLGALLPARAAPRGAAGRVAVVVPAHNEGGHILPTLADIKAQLKEGDRLIVVADNCDDDTAEVAMRAGAACLIRNNPTLRGKGFALQFALDKLREDPPDVVVFLDADCRLGEGALSKIAGAAAVSDRPAQGLYLMQAGEGAPANRMVAEFAWLTLNRVRMAGLSTLFDVCRLTGSGLALPWRIAEGLDLASAEIVEDLALTAQLVSAGEAPVFVQDATITSEFPYSDEGAVNQHARWEHGSLRFALKRAPAMLADAAGEADIRKAAAAIDMIMPPLTLFAAALVAATVASALLRALRIDLPLELCLSATGLFGAAALVSWIVFGRQALPPSAFGAVFGYAAEKAKVYGARARATTAAWTRTDRDGPGAAS
ncbi:MAG: glycosyltransferase [Alphaproteobacteria bacterium]|nr:glycosyltransferase [Alphaproteobacteria bacterium]